MSVPGDKKFKYTHTVSVNGSKFYVKVGVLVALVLSVLLLISLRCQMKELQRSNEETQRRLDSLRKELTGRTDRHDMPQAGHNDNFVADKINQLEQTLAEMQRESNKKSQMVSFKLEEIARELKKN
jgi:HAMP domain-containing protein